jgi:hypothetical protein
MRHKHPAGDAAAFFRMPISASIDHSIPVSKKGLQVEKNLRVKIFSYRPTRLIRLK